MIKFILLFALIFNAEAAEIPYHEVKIKKGDSFGKLFKKDWKFVSRFNRLDEKHLVIGKKIRVPENMEDLKKWTPLPREIAEAAIHKKYIFVSLEDQFLGAYENGRLAFDMPISSGKRKEKCDSLNGDCLTPSGLFRVLGGDRNHTSSIYDDPTGNPYPMLWAIRFNVSKGGVQYWIHGGDLPGYPASHGCVRLMPKDARKLFKWVFPKAPKNEFWLLKNSGIFIEIR